MKWYNPRVSAIELQEEPRWHVKRIGQTRAAGPTQKIYYHFNHNNDDVYY